RGPVQQSLVDAEDAVRQSQLFDHHYRSRLWPRCSGRDGPERGDGLEGQMGLGAVFAVRGVVATVDQCLFDAALCGWAGAGADQCRAPAVALEMAVLPAAPGAVDP